MRCKISYFLLNVCFDLSILFIAIIFETLFILKMVVSTAVIGNFLIINWWFSLITVLIVFFLLNFAWILYIAMLLVRRFSFFFLSLTNILYLFKYYFLVRFFLWRLRRHIIIFIIFYSHIVFTVKVIFLSFIRNRIIGTSWYLMVILHTGIPTMVRVVFHYIFFINTSFIIKISFHYTLSCLVIEEFFSVLRWSHLWLFKFHFS